MVGHSGKVVAGLYARLIFGFKSKIIQAGHVQGMLGRPQGFNWRENENLIDLSI